MGYTTGLFVLRVVAFFTVSQSLPFVVFHASLFDWLVFNKIKQALSGQVRILLSGVAPLPRHVKESLRITSGSTLSQGYEKLETDHGILGPCPYKKTGTYSYQEVKEIEDLRHGYNIVGLSQGNLIARGIIEFCDGRPPVKNFISLGGPHAGIASIPYCKYEFLCKLFDPIIKSMVYSRFIQAHLAPSGYVKISTDMDAYIKGCEFLRYLNNEIIGKRNSTYRSRFSSLENVVFIKFDHDEVLIPKETAWFGYYAEGTSDPVLPAQKTKLYEEDWIGLRTLDEVGKAKFISVSGNHLDISLSDMKTFIVPYLKDPISMVTRPEIDTLRALI